MKLQRTIFAALLLCSPLLLRAAPPESPAGPSHPAPDRSTPTAALRTLIAAIESSDLDAFQDSVALPAGLDAPTRRAFIEQLFLATQLEWWMEQHLPNDQAFGILNDAGYRYFRRVDPDQVQWRQAAKKPAAEDQPATRMYGTSGLGPTVRHISMVLQQDQWKAQGPSGTADSPVLVPMQNIPERTQLLRQTMADCASGKLATFAQIRTALSTPPVTAATTLPAGVPGTELLKPLLNAIEQGNHHAVESALLIHDDSGETPRFLADRLILSKKIESAIRARFPTEQGNTLAETFGLKNSILRRYLIAVWTVDGNTARVDFRPPDQRYDAATLLTKIDGLWCLEFRTLPIPKPKNAEKIYLKELRKILANIPSYATVGDLREAINAARTPDPRTTSRPAKLTPAEELERTLAALRQAEAQIPPGPQNEPDRIRLATLFACAHATLGTAQDAARFYYAAGDDGSYTVARLQRFQAGRDLELAAYKQLDVSGLSDSLGLANEADDSFTFRMLSWTVTGDTATPNPLGGDNLSRIWLPKMKKVAGQWRIDVSEEIATTPQHEAARAAAEAVAIQTITTQLNSGQFQTIQSLRTALTNANIKGNTKTRNETSPPGN